jgi:putative acetyltransferase
MFIRPYEAGDAVALSDLYTRSVLHFGPCAYTSDQVNAWAAASSPEKVTRRCADGRLVLVAMDENGQYLGFGDLENDGHLDFLYIAPEAEGRGVGSALYDALEAHAREVAMPKLFVEASELAKPLLERRGFVVRARNELTLGGVDIHNFSMEKLL